MPYSAGSYSRTDGTRTGTTVFSQQKAASVKITASLMDAEANDMATALSSCMLKDGTQTITADIPFGTNKITGLKDGTANADAPNCGQVQDGSLCYGGETGGSATAYTATLAPAASAYTAGMTVVVKVHATNTGSATLDVNSVGASGIVTSNITALKGGELYIGAYAILVYNGSNWQLVNPHHQPSTWTPTYGASGSMTFTSVTTNKAIYTEDGPLVRGTIYATGTIGGTPSTGLTFTLPLTAADTGIGGGAMVYITGGFPESGYHRFTSSTVVTVARYDTSNHAAGATSGFSVNFEYEKA